MASIGLLVFTIFRHWGTCSLRHWLIHQTAPVVFGHRIGSRVCMRHNPADIFPIVLSFHHLFSSLTFFPSAKSIRWPSFYCFAWLSTFGAFNHQGLFINFWKFHFSAFTSWQWADINIILKTVGGGGGSEQWCFATKIHLARKTSVASVTTVCYWVMEPSDNKPTQAIIITYGQHLMMLLLPRH